MRVVINVPNDIIEQVKILAEQEHRTPRMQIEWMLQQLITEISNQRAAREREQKEIKIL